MNIYNKKLNDKEKLNLIRIIRSDNIGIHSFIELLKIYHNIDNIINYLSSNEFANSIGKKIKLSSLAQAERELEMTEKIGGKIISFLEPEYPKLLKEIKDFPPIISYLGDISLASKTVLAIVGTRNASLSGCNFASQMASDLGKKSFIISSGLARGIDTASHKASIDTGTVAVIANGIDKIYPKENEKLYKEIAEKGCIISELPIGTLPISSYFPQRNRIISGISVGVIVIEATMKSGTLITARTALEQGRELFAVPGSPMDQRAEGTNMLIKQGANVVSKVDDIVEALEYLNSSKRDGLFENDAKQFKVASNNNLPIPKQDEINEAKKIILDKLTYSPVSIDNIVNITKLDINLVLNVVFELEISKNIERHFGNKISLSSSIKRQNG